jgi:hypothetical protein
MHYHKYPDNLGHRRMARLLRITDVNKTNRVVLLLQLLSAAQGFRCGRRPRALVISPHCEPAAIPAWTIIAARQARLHGDLMRKQRQHVPGPAATGRWERMHISATHPVNPRTFRQCSHKCFKTEVVKLAP